MACAATRGCGYTRAKAVTRGMSESTAGPTAARVGLSKYPRLLIPLKAMLKPGVWTRLRGPRVSEGHSALRALPIWVGCAATWGHDNIQAWAAAWDHVRVCGPTTDRVCYVYGPRCHQRPHRCLRSRLYPMAYCPKTMLPLGPWCHLDQDCCQGPRLGSWTFHS